MRAVFGAGPFAQKRASFELWRYGIDADAIRQVVDENSRRVFGIRERAAFER